MEIQIRPLKASDQDFLWDMLYESIYTTPEKDRPGRKIVEEPNIRKYAEHWGQLQGDWGIVAGSRETQDPLGALWLRYFTAENRGYGFVDDKIPELGIALYPAYRGLGIGTKLVQRAMKIMPESIQSLSLSVDPANPAVRLYKRYGFKEFSKSGSSITMLYTRY